MSAPPAPRYWQTEITAPGNGLRYRIQVRWWQEFWMQRHIWYPPTLYVEKVYADEWIRTTQSQPPAHFTETDDPDADLEAP